MNNLKIEKKESIGEELLDVLYFPSADVLFVKEDQEKRLKTMQMLQSSNNGLNGRLKIQFEDIEGVKNIELSQWIKTDKEIKTIGNGHIPIHRIKRISLIK